MRLQFVSDIHTEFHADDGIEWARRLGSAGADALVLAGDIGTRRTLLPVLKVLCDRFPRVIHVAGNHEYYGSSFEAVHDMLDEFAGVNPTYVRLERSSVDVAGVRVHGATLWYPKTFAAVMNTHSISDFSQIEDCHAAFDVADDTRRWLNAVVQRGDVVVTHHLPAWDCVGKAYVGNPINCYFVHDVPEVFELGPAAWIHGHTHESRDFMVKDTRVVCNPHGYPRSINPAFVEEKCIDV